MTPSVEYLHPSGLILPFEKKKDRIWTPQKDLLFRIKKYTDVFIKKPFNVRLGVGNYLRLEVVGLDGRKRWLTDWFHNNITNNGMNQLATSGARWNACQVGTGNAPVADSNTTLQTFLAGTTTRTNAVNISSGDPLYYAESYFRYDFATGAVVGNITELGVGSSASTGSNLFCRELVRDPDGNPVSIAVSNTETLRIHYRIRNYPPLVDVTGTLNGTITGAPATRNFTRRVGTVSSAWVPVGGTTFYLYGNMGQCNLSTGNLGTIATVPSGGIATSTDVTVDSYTPGSYTRTSVASWGITLGNQANRSLQWRANSVTPGASQSSCQFQCAFDTTIVKTNTQTLSFTFTTSWSRY